MARLRTLFLGTPAIAVPFLDATRSASDVVSVVTNPDQPAGRGYELRPSPVKQAATSISLPLLQPQKASEPGFVDQVRALAPDVGIVVAYGKLLPASLLSIPKFGFLNVHFSLLPAYRGAAPMQWTLINGESESGVTLFWLDEGMDTGPLFLQKRVPVASDDKADSLQAKLVALGIEALGEAFDRLGREGRVEMPQSGAASRAPMLTKEDGHLRWNESAQANVNRMRGTSQWPGAFAILKQGDRDLRLKVLQASVVSGSAPGEPGTVVRLEGGKGFLVKCAENLLEITQVQPEGKKPMSAWDFWQGARLHVGDKLH